MKKTKKEPNCIRIGVDSLDEQRGYVDIDVEILAERISWLEMENIVDFLNCLAAEIEGHGLGYADIFISKAADEIMVIQKIHKEEEDD